MVLTVLLAWALLDTVTAVFFAALGRAGLQDERADERAAQQVDVQVPDLTTTGR